MKNLKRTVTNSHGVSNRNSLGLHTLFFLSTGVVSHVILPSQQVESDAAPALTAVGEAGNEIIEER